MFSQKPQQNMPLGPSPLELLEQQMLELREQIAQTNQKLDKFINDATAALNVLDSDILDIKEKGGKEGFSSSSEAQEIRRKLSDLALVGKLALDSNERLAFLEAKMLKFSPEPPKKLSPKEKHGTRKK